MTTAVGTGDTSVAIEVRRARVDEFPRIATVFSRSVHELTRGEYAADQRHAWAPKAPDVERWQERCAKKNPWVAVVDETVAGFLELDDDGHIDCAYTHPDFARRGVMTRLLTHAIAIARARGDARVYAEVSKTARPVFEKHGFVVTGENQVQRAGVTLVNYDMELTLD